MSDDTAPDWISQAAKAAGPMSHGGYRVVVVDARADLSVRDFDDRERAVQYANDAASESDDEPPLAYVFDDRLQFMARGRHYAFR